MPRNNHERAQNAHDNIERQAGESHAEFQRRAEQAHSTFEGNNQSVLGSGRSTTPEPAQAGGGSLDLVTMTVFAAASMLGAAAVAKVLGRRS